jgi:hypothetical protein
LAFLIGKKMETNRGIIREGLMELERGMRE